MGNLMEGKVGIIFGVSNKRSIAYGIAKTLHNQGAELVFTYAGELMKNRVEPIAKEFNAKLVLSCDVQSDEEIKAVFDAFKSQYDCLDFVVHSIAFAHREDLIGEFSETSRKGWDTALSISAYSLIPMAKYAKPLMHKGGSIVAMSYLGGEKSVPNYNVMGVAKAALEASVRYLAAEFGEYQIRVNAISAGPIKTLAAKGIGGFEFLLKINQERAPMKRNISLEEVGNSGLYFCSDLSSGVSGETHHVDCGYHSVAISKVDTRIVGIELPK